jgi:hypothetical protein
MLSLINEIKPQIDNALYSEFLRVKEIEPNYRKAYEDELIFKYYSWDKSGCSIVGMITILLWYVACIENSDPYRNDEYKNIIEFLGK